MPQYRPDDKEPLVSTDSIQFSTLSKFYSFGAAVAAVGLSIGAGAIAWSNTNRDVLDCQKGLAEVKTELSNLKERNHRIDQTISSIDGKLTIILKMLEPNDRNQNPR